MFGNERNAEMEECVAEEPLALGLIIINYYHCRPGNTEIRFHARNISAKCVINLKYKIQYISSF